MWKRHNVEVQEKEVDIVIQKLKFTALGCHNPAATPTDVGFYSQPQFFPQIVVRMLPNEFHNLTRADDLCEILFVSVNSFLSTSPGSKAMDYSNGLFDCQSPTSPFLGGLRVLHLLEDLRAALELMDNEERDNLRCQIPDSTAEGLAEWLHGRLVKRPFEN